MPFSIENQFQLSGQMQQQIRSGFVELKNEVTKELIGNPDVLGQTFASQVSMPGFQATQEIKRSENNGLMDVDMLDVGDLEKERGDLNGDNTGAGKLTVEEA